MESLTDGNLTNIVNNLYEFGVKYGVKLLMALLTLIVGLWIIKVLVRGLKRSLLKKNIDATLIQFFLSLFSIILKVMLFISVISMVGIEMTSFVAILAAAGLAVGMALSGTLQNFAGGVIIVLFKPFKVGDFIDAQGYMGTVKEILIFNTILVTPDNKTIIIPNGGLSGSSMTNFSSEPTRRVDLTFGIGYKDDIDTVRSLISGLINAESRILADPPPFIGVNELAEGSVKLVVRVWVMAENYWDVYFEMNEEVKKAFDRESIRIPYPQRDVHIYKEK